MKAKNRGKVLVTITNPSAAQMLLVYARRVGVPAEQLDLLERLSRRQKIRTPRRVRLPSPSAADREWLEAFPTTRGNGSKDMGTKQAAALTLPIEEMKLTVRAYNTLKRDGINTIEDLIERTEVDLKDLPGLGPKSLGEVKLKLAGLGHQLKAAADARTLAAA
jgi:hypothetical protein